MMLLKWGSVHLSPLKNRIGKMEKIEKTLIGFIFGMFIVMIGMASNFLAIQDNGKMPVYAGFEYEDNTHYNFQDLNEVNYTYLTDIMYFSFANWGYYFSIGDIFLISGGIICSLFGGKYVFIKVRERCIK
jgi:hypothetical protein